MSLHSAPETRKVFISTVRSYSWNVIGATNWKVNRLCSVLRMENGHGAFPTVQVFLSFFVWFHSFDEHFSKWNLLLGISCLKPGLPEQARILHGSSYSYSDRLVVSCGNGRITEIVCNADGQWSQEPEQVCHAWTKRLCWLSNIKTISIKILSEFFIL